MGSPTVEGSPSSGERGTANQRFRTRDRIRLYGCFTLSAALHVVLVLAWPELSLSDLEAGHPSGASALELISLDPGQRPGDGLVAVPVVPQEGESSSGEAEEEGRETPTDGSAGGSSTADERRTEALRRVGAVTPGVLRRHPDPPTDPIPEPSADVERIQAERSDAEDPEREDVRIRAASSRLYGRLSKEELLRLERLSSIRPELAFGSTSSWLVLQNPSAVKDFMRQRFGRGRDGGPAHGRLSVSLWVDERGSVEWAEINRSSGRSDLDEAALELFEEVVAFTPARSQGMGVPTAAIFWVQW